MEDPTIQSEACKESNLKSLRESKGLSLRDIFEQTRISVIHLESIEKGTFHLLPPPVFTKAFIKTYAKTLGGDSRETLKRYEKYLETLQEPTKSVDANPPSETKRKTYTRFLWTLLIVAVAGIVIFSIFSYQTNVDISKDQINQSIYQSSETPIPRGETKSSTAEVQNEVVDQINRVSPSKESEPTPIKASQIIPAVQKSTGTTNIQHSDTNQGIIHHQQTVADTYRLMVEAKELTWIRIKAGKNAPQEILLKPGEKIEKSAPNFNIDIGNAGGITIDFHGKLMENLGTHGQVLHLKLP